VLGAEINVVVESVSGVLRLVSRAKADEAQKQQRESLEAKFCHRGYQLEASPKRHDVHTYPLFENRSG
jgi:hypothetical protein